MSPVLEVLAPEGYFWVGWNDVQFLDVQRPCSLLDLIWAPARLGLASGVIGAVAVPGLYSTSWKHADPLVRLGRRNEWIDLGAGLIRGAGAKVYQVGDEYKALVELQDLAFSAASPGDRRKHWGSTHESGHPSRKNYAAHLGVEPGGAEPLPHNSSPDRAGSIAGP